MIELRHLRKAFAGKPALHDLSLEVRRGEIFGLLGHNGAGKSTTLGILLGQVYPDGGEALIEGVSVQQERGRALGQTGAIFEAPRFYDYLSGWRNLEIYTSYSARVPKEKIAEAVETVGLTQRIRDRVGTYSQGMRQRLGLAQALLPDNKLLLLDEPTNGLDPEGIHEMRGLIQRLNRERGITVLFCSHLLVEVEQLCDRVAILNQGCKVFDGRWAELALDQRRVRLEVDDWEKAAGLLAGVGKLSVVERGMVSVPKDFDIAEIVARLVQGGVRVRAVEPQRQNLEEIYLSITHNAGVAPFPPMSLFFLQLRGELWKLFARKRTYLGFGAFLALEIVILLLFQLPGVQRTYRQLLENAGYGFEQYFSGITLAFQIVLGTTTLLGGLYLALVAGDIVAKEVEDGTLRMTLCRPVSRLRILAVKYLVCVIYTFTLAFFIGLSALVVGVARQGTGGFFVFQPLEKLFVIYDFGPGLVRYLASLPALGLSLLSVTSFGFMISCCNVKPAAATISTLCFFIADLIFRGLPYFESIKHWFISTHTETWYNMLRSPLPWQRMIEDYAYLFGVDATFVLVGVVIFSSRDFKS